MRVQIIILLLLFAAPCLAQEQPGYDQLGDNYFRTYRYNKAAPVYERLSKQRKAKPVVFYRLGYSYEQLHQYDKAIAAYTTGIAKAPGADSLWVRVGDMQKMQGKYADAKNSYSRYRGGRDMTNRMAGCDSAQLWTANEWVQLQNLSDINSTYSDWGAYREHGYLIYTSNFNRMLPVTQKISKQTGEPYFRVFRFSRKKNWFGELSTGDLSTVIDVSRYHIGPACYHGDSVYFTVSQEEKLTMQKEDGRKVGTRRLELFVTDGKSKAVAFPYNNAAAFSTGHAAVSKDGSVLYFVSDRPGGLGGTDIWYCRRDAGGGWQPPQNCGAVINTPDDEMFPVIGDDGQMYLASNGHVGMGGLDIFKASGAENQWQQPENLKPPFNSGYDDFYFVPADTTNGFLASNRPGGKGSDDIYTFTQIVPPPPPPPPLPPPPPPPPPTGPPPPKAGDVFVIRNLYYDFDKSNIRPDAAHVLDSLAGVLEKYPTMQIELSAHTDSRGKDAYNQQLSERRADAAVQYLIRKGIAAGRLTAAGYGETKLVNHCANGVKCTDEEHQENRRTEVKVLKM